VVLGQASLGFSVTDAFKKVGNVVVKAHTIPTKATLKILKDPRTQQVANVAAQQYAPKQYQQAQGYVAQAQALLRRPTPVAPPPTPVPMMMEEDPGPINRNSQILTIAAIGAGALVLFLMMRK
jgi:hypothetical protein